LERVAAGELSPTEAAEQLADLDATATPSGPGSPTAASPGDQRRPAASVRIEGGFRSCRVLGDPAVAEAVVEGPHTVQREGDVLVVRADDVGSSGWSFTSFGRDVRRGSWGRRPLPLSVRVNPALPLEISLDASTVSVDGVHGPVAARIDAGSLRVTGSAAPLDLRVDAGLVVVDARLASGDSHVRCDVGDVKVILRPGSDVRVRANVDIGHVALGPHVDKGFHAGGAGRDLVVGAGTATLDIHGGIGRVKVETA
jgi:hypothetical protein